MSLKDLNTNSRCLGGGPTFSREPTPPFFFLFLPFIAECDITWYGISLWLVSCPGDVSLLTFCPLPRRVRERPDGVPALLSSRHNTHVITLLFHLQVQSKALYGLLQGKLTSQPDPVHPACTLPAQLAAVTTRRNRHPLSL